MTRVVPLNSIPRVPRRMPSGAELGDSGRLDVAVQDYGRAITLDPVHTEYYLRRAGVHCAVGDFDKALADANDAVHSSPTSAAAYWQRGVIYCSREDFQKAIQDFDKAVGLEPSNAKIYLSRGECLLAAGKL